MIRNVKRIITMVFASVAALSFSMSVYAAEPTEKNSPVVQVSFDFNDRVVHEKTITLPDGTEATVGAEPVESESKALSGTWRIYGHNALATMEYYISLAPSGRYTTISNTYGLAISGTLSSFENERINVIRKTETASNPAIVEGYAKFNYLGNQWVSIWTQSGGVRASIKNDVITTSLY